MNANILLDQVSHDHKIDLRKIAREFDIRWAVEREQAAGRMFGPFHREYIFRTARNPGKVRKILRGMLEGRAKGLIAGAQGFFSSDLRQFPDGDLRAAINTTTTETNLWDPAIFAPLPVGAILAGRAWQLDFGGVMGTTATPTISFRARCGTNNAAPPTGTDLGVGPTMTLGTFTAQPWIGGGLFGCRTLGRAASATVMTGNGWVICPGAAAATTVVTAVFGGIVATIDGTIAQALGVSVIWGASSASNTLTPQWLMFGARN